MNSEIPQYEKDVLKILNLNSRQYSIKNNHIVEIKIHHKNLQTFPRNFWNLKYLQKLQLSSTNLRTIPESIENLVFIRKVYCFSHKFMWCNFYP